MRSQPPGVVSSLLAQDTTEAYLVLLTLEDGAGEFFRFTSDSVDTVIGQSVVDAWALEADPDVWETESGDFWVLESDTPGGVPTETYYAFPFEITLPNNVEDQISTARLSITNIDRTLVNSIRDQTVPIKVSIDVVLASTFELMVSYRDFLWRQLSYDSMTISGTLTLEDFLNEQLGHIMTSRDYPGLFYS